MRKLSLRRGITRTVWLVGPWAVKFPSLRYGGVFFIRGMLANMEEAWKWIDAKDADNELHQFMAPVLWCSWFGLVQVMRRAEPLKGDVPWFPEGITTDMKRRNFGTIDGLVVCIDYA